jgi:AraC-like DNA-binding protein
MDKDKKYLERASYQWSEDSVRLVLTPGRTARAIFFYIQEAGYFKTEPPYFTERANLDSYLILYTISGKGYLTYLGKEYELTEGTCFYIHCMNYHYYKTVRNEKWEFLWIHFNGTNALGYYKEYSIDGFDILKVQDTFLIESTLRRIVSVNQKKAAYNETLTSNLIINILTELLIQKSVHNETALFMPDYVTDTIKYVDINFQDSLNLDQLADMVNISKYYLAKEFKYHTGSTVNEYIISCRISHGKELLKYSELTVNEIAYRTGFHNVSHFINIFKAREGITPLAFRRQWKSC